MSDELTFEEVDARLAGVCGEALKALARRPGSVWRRYSCASRS
ncbi:MAG: hypothetical protein M5R42_20435 [Rhodocyclaceae bacterium]|nr:hypothetical protein [Rhodocyclaceae bacterium]